MDDHDTDADPGTSSPGLLATPVPTRPRHDGWTVGRQLDFLHALSRTRSVTKAARAVGMSRESAHRFRKRNPHGLFAAAWDRAFVPPAILTRAQLDEDHRRSIDRACRTKERVALRNPRSASIS
jgi:hypothetical protein